MKSEFKSLIENLKECNLHYIHPIVRNSINFNSIKEMLLYKITQISSKEEASKIYKKVSQEAFEQPWKNNTDYILDALKDEFLKLTEFKNEIANKDSKPISKLFFPVKIGSPRQPLPVKGFTELKNFLRKR